MSSISHARLEFFPRRISGADCKKRSAKKKCAPVPGDVRGGVPGDVRGGVRSALQGRCRGAAGAAERLRNVIYAPGQVFPRSVWRSVCGCGVRVLCLGRALLGACCAGLCRTVPDCAGHRRSTHTRTHAHTRTHSVSGRGCARCAGACRGDVLRGDVLRETGTATGMTATGRAGWGLCTIASMQACCGETGTANGMTAIGMTAAGRASMQACCGETGTANGMTAAGRASMHGCCHAGACSCAEHMRREREREREYSMAPQIAPATFT
jgi:hypothetical protein